MQLTQKTKSFRRSLRQPKAPARRAWARSTSGQHPSTELPAAQARARRGSGIEDRALYSCECGFAWTGEVTASPCCAHCGTPQAW